MSADWENIWHGGKRLMGAKRRPRHRRVIGTRIKESWIYRHGANLEHHGVRYWLCRICHVKKSYSTALYVSSGTSHTARHLLRQHQITEAGESDPSLATPFTLAATSGSSLSRLLSRQASLGLQLASRFEEGTWKACCYNAQSCRVLLCVKIQLFVIFLLFKNHQGLLYLSYL
jgi:hypothetical protein